MTKEKKDLKPEETEEKSEETQTDDKGQSDEAKRIAELEAENVKLASDNVNYKKAITNKSVEEFTLEDEEPAPSTETVQTAPKVEDDDEAWKEVERRAQAIAKETYIGQSKKEVLSNEKVAKKAFFAENPEALTDSAMQAGVREYYVNRHGKTPEGIKMDMQTALNTYKLENNIPIVTEKPEETNVETPNMPTGDTNNTVIENDKLSATETADVQEFNRAFDLDLSEDTFIKYKEAVQKGERSAPQEVINYFNQS